ncbi:type II secretion system secretin GspD [uncultured Thiodictyon sp.]|uniref:type II secretion system secretin GspD n=1 Tax=uncultured Thiodictyon sp. TaxID=1846217 RepID=UPI0025EE9F62|nr:type II secretion system secretin GspD [uncultured Thiodictyon sp.]
MHLDHYRHRRVSRRLGSHPRCALFLIPLVLGLAGCARSYWDPTVKVGESSGHLTGRVPGTTASGAPAQGPGEGAGIALGDEKTKKAVDSVKRGTGTFVRRISGPTVDTTPGDITLNFDGQDIREAVKTILDDLLHVNYVLSPAVQGTASLKTARPLRREDLIPTLETLLRMNNAAIVYKSGTYEVVPIANAVQGNLVPQLGESTRALPSGYSIQIVPLQYISAEEMNRILQPLAPEGSIIRVDTLRNLLLIAGTSPEMGNLIDTIKVFDVDWMKGLSVGFFVLEYAKAKDVVTQLEGLLADDSGNPMKGLFRFVPVEGSNSLMVISPQESYIQQARNWIERLDMAEATGSAAERLFVYRVKHGKAADLADVLSQLFNGDGKEKKSSVGGVAPGLGASTIGARAVIGQMGSGMGGGSSGGLGNSGGSNLRNTGGSGLSGGGQGVSGGIGGGQGQATAQAHTFEMSAQVSVVADAVNNSILVRANPKDYKKILDALKQLDIVPLQVLVEATIIEVSLTGDLQYGVQWGFKGGYGGTTDAQGNKSGGFLSMLGLNSATGGAKTIGAAAIAGTVPGFNWTVIARPGDILATLNALAKQNLVHVLSSPSVMVINNEAAKIQVGQEVPVTTQQQQSTQSANSNIINSVSYKDTGVILKVKPHVTTGGLVQMDISQVVSDIASAGTNNNPTFTTRSIESTVAVRSNQAVVLGGLIQDGRTDDKQGVPGLYDLPYAGALFGVRSKNAKRTELVVILTPKVIASDQDIEAVSDSFRDRIRGLESKF